MSLSEKLVILIDRCDGLLAQLGGLIEYKEPKSLDVPTFDKIKKTFIKKFPEIANVSGVKGDDIFKEKADLILDDLKPYYSTFVNISNWQIITIKVLEELKTTIVDMKFETTPKVLELFFTLFCGYCKIFMLIQKVESRRMILPLYQRLWLNKHGTCDDKYDRICKIITDSSKDVVKWLQEQLNERFHKIIISTLTGLNMNLASYSTPKLIRSSGLLSTFAKEENLAWPVDTVKLRVIANVGNFREWVLFGTLMCPNSLENIGVMKLALRELGFAYRHVIYRNYSVDFATEFEKLFGSFRIPARRFKLSKHKKLLKELFNVKYLSIIKDHGDMRTFLRIEMKNWYFFFNEFPGCIPPKMGVILALLSLAKTEINWYFAHIGETTRRNKKVLFKEDPLISTLIYWVDRFYHKVLEYQGQVQEYYIEYLTGTDLVKYDKDMKAILANQDAAGDRDDLEKILENITYAKVTDDLGQTIRRKWLKTTISLHSVRSKLTPRDLNAIDTTMFNAVWHSSLIDAVEPTLRAAGSLQDLYWHGQQMAKVFNKALVSSAQQPENIMALIRTYNYGLFNVHWMHPEEQKTIGARVIKVTEGRLIQVMDKISEYAGAICNNISQYRRQIDPMQVIKTYMNKAEARKRGEEYKEKIPGYESLYRNRNGLKEIKAVQRKLSQLCSVVNANDSVLAYTTEFLPKELLYLSVTEAVRARVRAACFQNGSLNRPSAILAKIKDTVYAFNLIDKNCPMSIEKLWKEVLASEFADGGSGIGEPTYGGKDGTQKKPIVLKIAQWYVKWITQDMESQGILFSNVKQGFVGRVVRQPKSKEKEILCYASNWASNGELKELCKVIGPQGIRIIEKGLLKVVFDTMQHVKKGLTADKAAFEDLRGKFSNSKAWTASLAKASNLDSVILATKKIGIVLKFRRLLKTALNEVLKQQIPFIWEAIGIVHASRGDETDPELTKLDYLANDVGFNVEEGKDKGLITCLSRFKISEEDHDLWALLPEVYGLAFVSSLFKSAVYRVGEEGYSNNAHLLVGGILGLMESFNSITIDKVEEKSTPVERITAACQSFIVNATYSVLHLKKQYDPNSKSGFGENYQNCVAFLDHFIRETKRVELSELEKVLPFSLMRAVYSGIYEKQTRHLRLKEDDAVEFVEIDEDDVKEQAKKEQEDMEEQKEEKNDDATTTG